MPDLTRPIGHNSGSPLGATNQGEIADEFGNTVIDLTADGDLSGDVLTDYIHMRIKNGTFAKGPLAGVGIDIDWNDFQRRMPYWDGPFDDSGGTPGANGAITWQWVADAGSPSHHNLRAIVPANCPVNSASYMEQTVTILGSRSEAYGDLIRAWRWTSIGSTADVGFQVQIQYLDADDNTTGSGGTSADAESLTGSFESVYANGSAGGGAEPDAFRLRIRLRAARIAGTAAGAVDISDVRRDSAQLVALFGDRKDGHSYSPGNIQQYQNAMLLTPGAMGLVKATGGAQITIGGGGVAGNDITLDGDVSVTGSFSAGLSGIASDSFWNNKGDLAAATANDTATRVAIGADTAILTADSSKSTGMKWSAAQSGTSFPGSPATNDVFFRTDRGIAYYYDGTRWLSVSIYVNTPMAQVGSSLPYAATASNADRIAFPSSIAGSTTFYIVDCYVTFRIAGGGTALGASHKWDVGVDQTDGSSLTTFAISSGASGAFRCSINSINSVVTGPLGYEIDYTKTGTPGNFMGRTEMTYRLIG